MATDYGGSWANDSVRNYRDFTNAKGSLTMRYFIEAVVNPFFIALILIAVAFCYQKKGGTKRCLGLALGILLIFSTGWFPAWLTQRIECQYPPVNTPQVDVGYVVVLSGGQSKDDALPANMQLYSASQKRLWEGLRLLHRLPKARLILSGGAFSLSEEAEAKHLRRLSQWCNIDGKRVILEDRSLSTKGQVRQLKKILGNNRFYLVTSAIHMPRAVAEFYANDMHPIAAPTDFTYFWNDERWTKRWIPNPHNLMYTSIVLHEFMGRLYYALTR